MNGFLVHVNFISNNFDCLSSIGSNKSLTRAVLSPVLFVHGRPLRCSSPTTFLPSESILCQRKTCSWHCIIFKGLLKFSMCCGGTVTEFNTKKKDVPCFHFHDKVQKHVLTCHALTPHWGIAKPCHFKWGRKDQGQRLSVLASAVLPVQLGDNWSHYFVVRPRSPTSSKRSPSLKFPRPNLSSRHKCYTPHLSHLSSFDHPDSTWWGVHSMKLLFVQSSTLPCYLDSYGLTRVSPKSSAWIWQTKFHTHIGIEN